MQAFLDDVVGGLRYDHTERAWMAVKSILDARSRSAATFPVSPTTVPDTPPAADGSAKPDLHDVTAAIAAAEQSIRADLAHLLGPSEPDPRRRNYNRRILFEILQRLELGIGDLLLSRLNPPPRTPHVRLRTEHPIAAHSLDHRMPLGSAQDNTRGLGFCIGCEALFPGPVRLLDLGCAGGGIVYDFLMRGHFAVGVEGSDYSKNVGRAAWRIFPNNLFTADLTKRFDILDDSDATVLFDIISCWEVLEHIAAADLPMLFDNVARHLRPGGLFVGTVAFSQSPYHQTVMPGEWWQERLAERFDLLEPIPFRREHLARGVSAGLFDSADYFASPERGWHFCVRARQQEPQTGA